MEILYRARLKKKKEIKLDRQNYAELMELSGQDEDGVLESDWEIWRNLSHFKTLMELGEIKLDWNEESGCVEILLQIRLKGD